MWIKDGAADGCDIAVGKVAGYIVGVVKPAQRNINQIVEDLNFLDIMEKVLPITDKEYSKLGWWKEQWFYPSLFLHAVPEACTNWVPTLSPVHATSKVDPKWNISMDPNKHRFVAASHEYFPFEGNQVKKMVSTMHQLKSSLVNGNNNSSDDVDGVGRVAQVAGVETPRRKVSSGMVLSGKRLPHPSMFLLLQTLLLHLYK